MRRRYRRTSKLSSTRRQRLMRVLAMPLFLRVGLPSLLAAYAIMGLVFMAAPAIWPTVNTNGWRFIIPAVAVYFAIGLVAFLIAYALFIRWLLRYRSDRHGRAVALGRCAQSFRCHAVLPAASGALDVRHLRDRPPAHRDGGGFWRRNVTNQRGALFGAKRACTNSTTRISSISHSPP